MQGLIYHLARRDDYNSAAVSGLYQGSAEDAADGFMHFSTAEQVRESAARHRAGERGLVLLACDAEALGPALKWEPSRGGQLFPHLYGPLPLSAVRRTAELPLNDDGRHVFPEWL